MNNQQRSVAAGVGPECNRTVRMIGNKVYVRKTIRPDEGLIALPEKLKDRVNWCEVLAAGDKVPAEIRPGDFVTLPEVASSNRMWNGPFGNEHELVVDCREIVLVLPKEEYECLMKTKP